MAGVTVDLGLLSRVARSFAITIRWLPPEIRTTVALGYLLARASDSIADSSEAELGRRVAMLERLRDGGEVEVRDLVGLAAQQPVAAEAELLSKLPELLDALRSSPDQARLEWVWDHILKGQLFDLQRFAGGDRGPLSMQELDEYTFAVAGSVGEFWTRLAFDRVPGFSKKPMEEMIRRGVSYGKGLQRINVLRDRAANREIGRVYVRDADFERVRVDAREGLEAGLAWCDGVDRRRLRFACLLPARIGLVMLPELRVDAGGMKISRGRLRGIALGALPTLLGSRASSSR